MSAEAGMFHLHHLCVFSVVQAPTIPYADLKAQTKSHDQDVHAK